jgi:hypothetical protein
MKRAAALVHLSHDHHHTLVAARRLRRAADADADARARAAAVFAAHFDAEMARHFAEEEAEIFPLLGDGDPLVAQALADHAWIRAQVGRLRGGDSEPDAVRELAVRVEAHVRLEERRLFDAVQRSGALDAGR